MKNVLLPRGLIAFRRNVFSDTKYLPIYTDKMHLDEIFQ